VTDSNLQKELELIKALIDKLFKHCNEQFDTQIKINRAVYYRLGKLEDAKLELKPDLSAPVKGWLPTGKEAAIAVNVCLWIVVLSCLIAQYVKAETPNWFLYDQRMGQKAQEYKDRWTTGNNDDKLANYYYDAARGFEYISRRLGDPSLTNTALAAANFYADNYVLANGGNVPGYWNFTDGLKVFSGANHRQAIISMATNGAFCRDSTTEDTRDTAYSRESAYCIRAMLAAESLGQPRRARLGVLVAHSQSHLEQWTNGTAPYVRPFMVGLTSISLIRASEAGFDPVGIRSRLQAIATKMKNELWVESARAFRYTDRIVADANDMEPAPDLNLLIAPMYAWLGDKEFAGKIFNGGTEQSWLGNLGAMKQFNQNILFVEEFERFYGTQPTPTATPTASTTPSLSPSPSPTVSPMPTVSPSPTPTTMPTVVPTHCQRPALMNSIKKLDTWTKCRIDRIVKMNNLTE